MKKNSFKHLILTLSLALTAIGATKINDELNDVVEQYKKSRFLNAIYYVSQGDEVLAHGAHGFFDLDSKKPLDESQIMPTASITKQFS